VWVKAGNSAAACRDLVRTQTAQRGWRLGAPTPQSMCHGDALLMGDRCGKKALRVGLTQLPN